METELLHCVIICLLTHIQHLGRQPVRICQLACVYEQRTSKSTFQCIQNHSCRSHNGVRLIYIPVSIVLYFCPHCRMEKCHVLETSDQELPIITWLFQPNTLVIVNHSAKNTCLQVRFKHFACNLPFSCCLIQYLLCLYMFCIFCSVKRMVELGKEILHKNNVTDLSDVRWVAVSVKTSLYWQLVLVQKYLFTHPFFASLKLSRLRM